MLRLGQAEWQVELSRFTPEQIYQALKQFAGEYPPSLPALVDACRQRAAHHRYMLLPRPAANPEVALSAVRNMRRALG